MTETTQTTETTQVGSRPARWALGAIERYQVAVEGRPSPCRFFPSCSSYAHEAVTRHGAKVGFRLTLRRFTRCRPFGPTGFDPVPDDVDFRFHLFPSSRRTPSGRCHHVAHEDC